MKNLNKFTKAELIDKISKNNEDKIKRSSFLNKFKSYLSTFLDFLLKLKGIIFKLTLISFFIQFFKKYKIFRRIWKIFNSIIVSIFGLSVIDTFGFEVMNNLFMEFRRIISNTVNYLTNTHFYMFLSKLFSTSTDEIESKSDKTGSLTSGTSWEATNHERKTSESNRKIDRNSKISEWLKPESEIQPEEIKEESFNYTKYLIITGFIIGSCLVWVYFDEIKLSGESFWKWIKSFKGDDDPGNNQNQITKRDELERLVKEKTVETEEKISDLMNKSKSKRISSPSLEDLNEKVTDTWRESTSPTSSSSSLDSADTVKASSSEVKIDPVLENSEHLNIQNTSILDVQNNWKNLLKPDLKKSIEYVEAHLPRNELDDTTYISQLLKDINQKNIEYLRDLNQNSAKIKASKLVLLTDIAKNLDKWIEEMKNEIDKFE